MISKDVIEKIIKKYKAGVPYSEIARRFSLTHDQVTYQLKKHGVFKPYLFVRENRGGANVGKKRCKWCRKYQIKEDVPEGICLKCRSQDEPRKKDGYIRDEPIRVEGINVGKATYKEYLEAEKERKRKEWERKVLAGKMISGEA